MIALWRGELPLSQAFWEYAGFYGLIAGVASNAAVAAIFLMQLPLAFAVMLHLLPVPYYVVATVGVWRSADRYQGAALWASAARLAVIVWVAILVVL